MIETFHFKSNKPGPKFLFTAGVHGDEQKPVLSLEKWIKGFQTGEKKLLKGEIKFIPKCNPKAFENNVRQIDANLNRVIKYHRHPVAYEDYLANELIPHLDWCDHLVDFHSYHCDDIPFVLLDNSDDLDLLNFVKLAKTDYITSGLLDVLSNKGQSDDFQAVHAYVLNQGKKSMAVECGQNQSDRSEITAFQTVENCLTGLGMIEGKLIHQQASLVRYTDIVFKKKEGQFVKEWGNFVPIEKGTVIARYDDGEECLSPLDGLLILPGPTMPVGSDWYWLGRVEER